MEKIRKYYIIFIIAFVVLFNMTNVYAAETNYNTESDIKNDNIMYGDVNLDGKIDSRDATRLMRYIKGEIKLTASEKKNADVFLDGKINSADTDILMKYLAGYEIILPYIGK